MQREDVLLPRNSCLAAHACIRLDPGCRMRPMQLQAASAPSILSCTPPLPGAACMYLSEATMPPSPVKHLLRLCERGCKRAAGSASCKILAFFS